MPLTQFHIYRAVTSYAVDDPGCQDVTTAPCGITEEDFYDSIYVGRPELEDKAYKLVLDGVRTVTIQGFAGCGKTSLARFVLRRLKKENGCATMTLDLKLLPPYDASTVAEGVDGMERIVKQQLLGLTEGWLRNRKSRVSQVVPDLLGLVYRDPSIVPPARFPANRPFWHSYDQLVYEYETRELPNNTAPRDIDKWANDAYKAGASLVVEAMKRMNDTIELPEMCLYLRHLPREHQDKRSPNVFLIDNLDNIEDDTARRLLADAIDRIQGELMTTTRFMITIRPNNNSRLSTSSEGAYLQDYVDLTESRRDKEGRVTPLREPDVQLQGDELDNEILNRRVLYVNQYFKKEGIDDQANLCVAAIRKVHQSVFAHGTRFKEASSAIVNLNRRLHLDSLSLFVDFLVTPPMSIPAEEIEPDEKEPALRLRSLYYYWLVEQKFIYDPSIMDFVRSVMGWHATPAKEDRLACVMEYQLVARVFNATGGDRGWWGTGRKVTAGEVVDDMVLIGHARDDVMRRMFDLYVELPAGARSGTPRGIIEFSRFRGIASPADISPELFVWQTPRAEVICRVFSRMLVHLVALLQSNGMLRNRNIGFDPRWPITPGTVRVALEFLCDMADMHLAGIRQIRRKLEDAKLQEDWFTWYRERFCFTHSPGGMAEDLQLPSILANHRHFLERLAKLEREGRKRPTIADQITQQYVRLNDLYSNEVLGFVRGQSKGERPLGWFRNQLDWGGFDP